MIFSLKNLTLDKLKEENLDLYQSIMDEATANVAVENANIEKAKAEKAKAEQVPVETDEVKRLKEENAALKASQERIATDSRIREFGAKLKVKEVADECIKAGMTFNEAIVKMADANANFVKDVSESFDDTSSAQAGTDTQSSKTDVEVKTFRDAIRLVAERDSISKMEAATKAQTEFKDLFDKQYEGVYRITDED